MALLLDAAIDYKVWRPGGRKFAGVAPLTFLWTDSSTCKKKKKRRSAESPDAKTHLLIDTHLKASVTYHSLSYD